MHALFVIGSPNSSQSSHIRSAYRLPRPHVWDKRLEGRPENEVNGKVEAKKGDQARRNGWGENWEVGIDCKGVEKRIHKGMPTGRERDPRDGRGSEFRILWRERASLAGVRVRGLKGRSKG